MPSKCKWMATEMGVTANTQIFRLYSRFNALRGCFDRNLCHKWSINPNRNSTRLTEIDQMFQSLKITIAQLMCLMAIVGSILFTFVCQPGEPFWRPDVLKYKAPRLPLAVIQAHRLPAQAHPATSGPSTQSADQSDLFMKNHQSGWESVRHLFYQCSDWQTEYDTFDFYDEYDYAKLSFRSRHELCFLAQWEGRQQCRQEIQQLLHQYDERQLRQMLAYPGYWAYAPSVVALVTALIVLAIWCPLRWNTGA